MIKYKQQQHNNQKLLDRNGEFKKILKLIWLVHPATKYVWTGFELRVCVCFAERLRGQCSTVQRVWQVVYGPIKKE